MVGRYNRTIQIESELDSNTERDTFLPLYKALQLTLAFSGSGGLRHAQTVAPDVQPRVGPRDPAGMRRHREVAEEGHDEGR